MVKESFHIVLAFILYLGTAGISVHSHYCNDELKGTSFWLKAESCHSAQKTCPHHPPKDTEKEKDCCDNQLTFEKIDTDLINLTLDQFPVDKLLPVFLPLKLNIELLSSNEQLAYQRYRPPPEGLSLHIQHQTFLC